LVPKGTSIFFPPVAWLPTTPASFTATHVLLKIGMTWSAVLFAHRGDGPL
jgi:hypothetical protein